MILIDSGYSRGLPGRGALNLFVNSA